LASAATIGALLAIAGRGDAARAAEPAVPPAPPQQLRLADGALELALPATWKKVAPKSQIIEHEFEVAPAEGDAEGGRLTIMAAGGGVEGNVARWVGQFRNPQGGELPKLPAPAEPVAEGQAAEPNVGQRTWKKQAGGLETHVVDLRGTYADRPRGPFGPAVDRENYQMLGWIVPTPKHGMWFVKMYGPRKTMAQAMPEFLKMIDSLKVAQ
jgi:hypothetical protein